MLALNVVPARQGGDAQTQAARALADSAGEVDALLVASDRFGSALLDIQGPRVLAERAPGDDAATHAQWTADLDEARRVGGLLAYVTWFPPADAGDWRAGYLWPNEPFVREGAGVAWTASSTGCWSSSSRRNRPRSIVTRAGGWGRWRSRVSTCTALRAGYPWGCCGDRWQPTISP